MSGLLAFGHGANDASKSVGVVAVVLLADGSIGSLDAPTWAKLACAVALTAGTTLGGWPIVRTIGRRIFRLRPLDGLAAETGSAVVLLAASAVGAPVSTTQVVATSVVGVGGGRQRWRRVRWQVVREIGDHVAHYAARQRGDRRARVVAVEVVDADSTLVPPGVARPPRHVARPDGRHVRRPGCVRPVGERRRGRRSTSVAASSTRPTRRSGRSGGSCATRSRRPLDAEDLYSLVRPARHRAQRGQGHRARVDTAVDGARRGRGRDGAVPDRGRRSPGRGLRASHGAHGGCDRSGRRRDQEPAQPRARVPPGDVGAARDRRPPGSDGPPRDLPPFHPCR